MQAAERRQSSAAVADSRDGPVAPAALYCPAEHVWQVLLVEAPMADDEVPAGHEVHCVELEA